LLAQGPKVTKQQAVDLLANTYGGYLASRADPQWRTRIAPQIQDLVNRMLANGLLEEYPDGTIHLTLLGSACGQSPFELASALQVVEMLRRLSNKHGSDRGQANAILLLRFVRRTLHSLLSLVRRAKK
jgi:helicase